LAFQISGGGIVKTPLAGTLMVVPVIFKINSANGANAVCTMVEGGVYATAKQTANANVVAVTTIPSVVAIAAFASELDVGTATTTGDYATMGSFSNVGNAVAASANVYYYGAAGSSAAWPANAQCSVLLICQNVQGVRGE
jgi:hypothetical protein